MMRTIGSDEVAMIPCGPAAIRINGISGDAEQDWRVVHKVAQGFARHRTAGVIGSIPTYESILVEFDPAALTIDAIQDLARTILANIDPDEPLAANPRLFTVPVLYGGEYGPDLADVAELTGLTIDEVVRRHWSKEYVVRCLGAPGGSPMLDGPEFPIPIPRLPSPRATVPVHNVSVAGRQATIAPTTAPGGWRVIGRTPLTVLDIAADPMVPYRPGDAIRFEPIDHSEYERLLGVPMRPSVRPR